MKNEKNTNEEMKRRGAAGARARWGAAKRPPRATIKVWARARDALAAMPAGKRIEIASVAILDACGR